jgi:hypothetical protein
MMLVDWAAKVLPASDGAYRAMSNELPRGLDDDLIRRVVTACADMPLVVNSVAHGAGRSTTASPAVICRTTSCIKSDRAPRISLPR